MKIIKIIAAALMAMTLAAPAMAQDGDAHDPNAKKILDKVQQTTQGYQTLRA